MKKRIIKIKWLNILMFCIFLSSSIFFCKSIFDIIKWKIDSKVTNNAINKLQESTTITEISDNEITEIIEQEEISKTDPYWDYIKMNMINVDFNELKKINNDVKGWIQVEGTNINYPFVQTTNNYFYLNNGFDKTRNEAGWIFMDYRNNLSNDKNMILYGHGRIDKTMFGSLRNILKSNWLNNKDNFIVKLSTEKENTLWQVFSIYHIPTTSDYIQTEFSGDEAFLKLVDKLIERSAYNFNTSVSTTDKILTLSTCYSETEKVVLHAKLIKKNTR